MICILNIMREASERQTQRANFNYLKNKLFWKTKPIHCNWLKDSICRIMSKFHLTDVRLCDNRTKKIDDVGFIKD